MQREYRAQSHYETGLGDRVTLLRLDDEWAISWCYGYPHYGTQVIAFGDAGPEAIDTFAASREGKSLIFDSRVSWHSGSI
jgi:hypothetical protein